MLYYYNRDGKFQKESSKEYKTEKGAREKLESEGIGAVYDETGNLIMTLEDHVENSSDEVPGTDEVPEADAAPETDAQQEEEDIQDAGTEEQTIFSIHTTCDVLNVRALPDSKSAVIGSISEKEPDKKEHPISKVENGWGKLNEAPGGYIQLAFARVVS